MQIELLKKQQQHGIISGFSALGQEQKVARLIEAFALDHEVRDLLKSFHHRESSVQQLIEEFSENVLSNFHLPFSVIPSLVINGKNFAVPLVTEESSVVAAASSVAKLFSLHGGVKAEVLDDEKVGQIHFFFKGDFRGLQKKFDQVLKDRFIEETKDTLINMERRGGGVRSIILVNQSDKLSNLYKIMATFGTCDAMGANFINTLLESWALLLKEEVPEAEVTLAILSNYTPNCLVKVTGSLPVAALTTVELEGSEVARKIVNAYKIAKADEYRATTHNKGIMNGVDAVLLAIGNDTRAVEACAHTFATRHGHYESLSFAKIERDRLVVEMLLPVALGTVGGVTTLHPLSKFSLSLMGNPDAKTMMKIVASVGLAQNLAAVKSLVTTGIQTGHMKMHLGNILTSIGVNEDEKESAKEYFKDKKVSYALVRDYVQRMRHYQ